MKINYLGFFISIALLASCSKVEDPFSNVEGETGTQCVYGEEIPQDHLLSQMNILVSDELSEKLEASSDKSGMVRLSDFQSLRSQGVVRMRRLFPEAGKFEARTRAEGLHKWYVLEYDPDQSMTRAADGLFVDGVEQIEYCPKIGIIDNYEIVECVQTKASSSSVFDDPMLGQQWHYYNDGSVASSISGCDINIVPVWKNYSNYYKYKGDIIVGVVDGGVDYKHEDLVDNMWHNPNNKGDNVYGYNFVNGNYNIHAESHGTHVAGTVAASNNNGIGVCGVAGGDYKNKIKGAKIMSCQIFDGQDQGSGAEAIKWSADNGAVISQNSWGYTTLTTTPSSLKAAVDYFEKYAGVDENGKQTGPMKGGLVIFAAGNENKNVSSADYEKILCVSSVGADYMRAYYSCFGDYCDVAAPGGDAKKGNQVLSTLPNNRYGKMQGTSMACPHVSGLAALLLSRYGGEGYTPAALRSRIESTCTNIQSQNKNNYMGKGLINAYKAMAGTGGKAPSTPKNLSAQAQSNNISFEVDVPSDSDDGKPNSIYIYYSTENFTSVSNAMFGMFYVEDLNVGDILKGKIGGLEFNTRYYVAAMACDLAGNKSTLSPKIEVTTGENSNPVLETNSSLDFSLKAHETKTVQFNITEPDGHFYYIDLEPGSDAAVLDTLVRESPKVRITGVNAETGSYSAKLKVTDIYGAFCEKLINYQILENHKPVMVREFDDMILNSKASNSIEIDCAEYFYDEDGEELSYSFSFTNENLANMTYSSGKLLLTPMNYGSGEITVTATDIRGETVSDSFRLLIQDSKKELTIYPNPVVDKMNIRLLGIEEYVNVSVIGASGATVHQSEYKDVTPFDPIKIDLSKIQAGQYTVIVKTKEKELKGIIVKL